jgi:hypothetical protein
MNDILDVNLHIDGKLAKSLKTTPNTTVDNLLKQTERFVDYSNIIIIYRGIFITDYNSTLNDINILDNANIYIYSIVHNQTFASMMHNFMANFMTMFNSTNVTNTTTQTITYDQHLITLNDMGFLDDDYNRNLLQIYNGDVNFVAELLVNTLS